jgi:hypothetical protein
MLSLRIKSNVDRRGGQAVNRYSMDQPIASIYRGLDRVTESLMDEFRCLIFGDYFEKPLLALR